MNKIAFIFPGQGSQYPGMGKELFENFPLAAEIINRANKTLDLDIAELSFNGPAEKLNITANTQPAIYTISYMINQILNEEEIYPEILAGHSLGEYSALASANVISFEEGLKLVRQRGIIMNNAVPDNRGAMAAIIGLEDKIVEDICQKVQGICEIANYNSPGQIVISGERKVIEQACKVAEEMGARKTVVLKVSGPFHSSMMKIAEEKFNEIIKNISFTNPEIPIISNVTGDFVEEPEEIKGLLIKQLSSSVRWVESIKLMISKGIDTFIEVGPGKVLKGLMKRIDRSVTAYNIEDMKTLENLLKKIK